MKTIVAVLFVVILVSCKDQSTQTEVPSKKHGTEHQKSHHGSANEYMHKSSTKELIERFESPERDTYQKPEKVIEFLGDLEGKTIMDIGAGSGYFSVKLAAKGAHVIAADVDEEFQKYLKKRIKENQLNSIKTRKIPYDSPGLKKAEVDMVLIVNTYHHIEKREDYFTKVKEGTKSQGSLIIIDFFKVDTPVGPPVDHKIEMDKVIFELKAAGYQDFDINVDLLPFQYIITAR